VDDFFNSDRAVAGRWTGGNSQGLRGLDPADVKALEGPNWRPEDAELTKENLTLPTGWDSSRRLGAGRSDWARLRSRDDGENDRWGVDGIINDDPGRLTSMPRRREE